jgi:hypothetical protein
MVLWELLKHILNELYSLGFKRKDTFSIYDITRKMRNNSGIERKNSRNIYSHLNSKNHRYVRNYLRNSFTHSNDPTSTNYLHEINENGYIGPCLDILPNHHYEALIQLIDDFSAFKTLINKINHELEDIVLNKVMYVQAYMELNCGKVAKIENLIPVLEIKECINTEITCELPECESCKHLISDGMDSYCLPRKIKYHRVNEYETVFELPSI